MLVSRTQRFKALTWRERELLFQAALMLPATALSVKVVGVKRWQNALAYLSRKGKSRAARRFANAVSSVSAGEIEIQTARKIARLVRAAANHGIYRANCLEQSLVLCWLLRRKGMEGEIRFGARKEEDQLHAHAWVECFGVALNEDRGVEERYAPFAGVTVNTPMESQ